MSQSKLSRQSPQRPLPRRAGQLTAAILALVLLGLPRFDWVSASGPAPTAVPAHVADALPVFLPLIQRADTSGGGDGAPVITSFAANPSTIAPGGGSTLSWAVTGATDLSISPDIGAVDGASLNVQPATTTTYMLTAANANGSTTATATVTVSSGQGGGPLTFFLPFQPGGSVSINQQSQVAVDAQGGVHVLYAAAGVDSSGARPAYYGYCPTNCASTNAFQTLSLSDQVYWAQLALDPAGHPRVLLESVTGTSSSFTAHYQYGECNGNCTDPAQWTLAEVETGQWDGFEANNNEQHHSFALDAQGRPRFVYLVNGFGIDPSQAGTFYAACDANCTQPANWATTQLYGSSLYNLSLAFTQAGWPRAAFSLRDQTGAPYVYYMTCDMDCVNAANWNSTGLVGTATSGFYGNVLVLRLDPNDNPRLALYAGTGSGGTIPPNRLYYLSCITDCLQANNWTVQDIGLPDTNGQDGVDLALDSQGHPRLAYRMPAPTDELGYAWCDASCETSAQGWQSQVISSRAAAQQEFPINLAQGCPSPECIPPVPGCLYAIWDAGYWPSLALDPAGSPVIGFDVQHWQTGLCTPGSDARLTRLAVWAR